MRTLLIAAAIAASLASVAALIAVSALAHRTLGLDSRAWLGADLAAETTEPIGDDQIAALAPLRSQGIEWTIVTWMLTLGASEQAADPLLLNLKVIDPSVYPFYGVNPVRGALSSDAVAVSDEVLARLRVHVGDSIRISGKRFLITARLPAEFGRHNGIFGWGPHALISDAGFERFAADATSNTLYRRVLLRVPDSSDALLIREDLRRIFPEAWITDYHDAAAPEVARMELGISFSSVISFLVLVIGAIGVAAAVRLNLEQRAEMFAILRMHGARTMQMVAVVLIESAALACAGAALAIPFAFAMKSALIAVAVKYLPIEDPASWDHGAILETGLAAMSMIMPLIAGPANALTRLRPMILQRRDAYVQCAAPKMAKILTAAAVAIAIPAAAIVAHQMVQAWKPALLLTGVITANAAVAWLLGLITLRLAAFAASFRVRPVLKHALLGLNRNRNQSLLLIVCLSLGTMILAATFSTGDAVAKTVAAALPYPRANLLIADFENSRGDEVRRFLSQQGGVDSVETLLRAKLYPAGGEKLVLAECATKPQGNRVTIAPDLAYRFGLSLGSTFDLETHRGVFHAIVASIAHPRPEERFWYTLTIDCTRLSPEDLIQAIAVRTRPGQLKDVRNALSQRFPALASISANEINSLVGGMTRDALTFIRLIDLSAGIGGVLILVAIVAASRGERIRQAGILAALGATRATIFRIYTLEFAFTGLICAILGSFLAFGLSSVILSILFHHAEMVISWQVCCAMLTIAPLLTTCAGWLPTCSLWSRKPMDVLRRV